MASNFKFKILTNTDPQAQYDAIVTKDPMTFYLLNTGIGYLGDVKLFDATDGTIKNLVTDMLSKDFVPDDVSAASTNAIVKYVTEKVSNISALLTVKFFRKVESHTITEDDITKGEISFPEGAKVGDVGLLFTADTDDKDGGESYYFIPLTDYLQSVYSFVSSNSIEMVTGTDNKITANLKIREGEESIAIDKEKGGVYVEKATVIDETKPSTAKLITEDALVKYIQNVLMPTVKEAIVEATEDMVTVTVDSLNREVMINGNSYTNLTEAINDIGISGTITLVNDTASDGIQAQSGSDFTIDLAGHSLILDGQMAGSAGTQTNALQLLKNSNITLKNGTIVAEDAKIVIQNYSNLTLDNVKIEGKGINQYLLSNNYGNIVLKNNTKISAQKGMVAFDLYYGIASAYDAGVTVTIADSSVVIEGPIEYGKAARASEEDFVAKCKLVTPRGYVLDIPDGYEWTDNGNGTQTLTKIATTSS